MALYAGIRQSRAICSFTSALKPRSSQYNHKQVISSYRYKTGHDNGNTNEGSSQEINWKLACKFGAAAGLTAIALNSFSLKNDILAEEKDEVEITQEIIDKENR